MKTLIAQFVAILCLIAPLTGCVSENVAPKAWIVSPRGNDANPGTMDRPFKTLAKAQQAARSLEGSSVILRGGTYPLDRTLVLGPEDSGHPWKAYSRETPVISGGKCVTGWTLHDKMQNIWKANVAGTDNFRQIYVNGVKAVRACSTGKLDLKLTKTGFSTTDMRLQNYGNIADMEIVAQSRPWTQQRFPVAAIQGGVISIKGPCWDEIVRDVRYYPHPRPDLHAPHLENAYEFMTFPGAWYHDRPTHTLYYIPRMGEDMTRAVVEVPVLEQLIVLAGTAQNPVSNLSFSGLTFRLSNWLQPSSDQGMVSRQANQHTWWTVKAAVDGTGARNVEVFGCTFRQLGGNGINILTASRNYTVNGCLFHDIAASAVQCGQGRSEDFNLPPGSGDIISDITVSNCTIHDVCTDYQAGCAVFFGYTRACTIAHNEIFDVPYSAISLGWGWTALPKAKSFVRGNKIVGNRIHDHMRVLADGGAIYCNGYQEEGLVSGNYVYNQGHVYAMLYLDDGATHWKVTGNVCQNAGKTVAWYLYKGFDNHADGNFTDDAFVLKRSTGPCTLERTTLVPKGAAWPAGAQAIMKSAGPR